MYRRSPQEATMQPSRLCGIAMGTTHSSEERSVRGEQGKIIGASIMLFIVIGVVDNCYYSVCQNLLPGSCRRPRGILATVSYVRICSVGAVFVVAYNVTGQYFQGLGRGDAVCY